MTKGKDAGKLLRMRDWQKDLIRDLVMRQSRRALIGFPRKNGKSSLGAALALYGLMADGEEGAEVYSVAADHDQAAIVFAIAKRMVELEPQFAGELRTYWNEIRDLKTGSRYKVLAADAAGNEGRNPSLVIFDEVHAQPNDELWNTFSLAMGTREHPLLMGITTAGVRYDSSGQDSICYQLWQYGKRIESGELEDDSFFFKWWGSPDGVDYRDPEVWKAVNPALGDFLFQEDFESAVKLTPENDFRTKRLNQWVSSQEAWISAAIWGAHTSADEIADREQVVLSFDGSFSGDSTGLTVHRVKDCFLQVVDLWEKPVGALDWQVDQDEVEVTIRQCFERWNVKHLVYDPRIWHQLMERLANEGYPMEPMPQGQAMINAANRFYEDLTAGRISHDGDPRLTRHLLNCTVKPTAQGWRVQKETPNSPRKIDLAICAVMGHAYAAELEPDYDLLESVR
ncbi:MAG: terminase large subunit [Nitriliruptorales bacterium]|nr:terminase large subunit [Nitriliruptorales bacterium]